VHVTGAGTEVTVHIAIAAPPPDSWHGFIETSGTVSIEAEHFTRNIDSNGRRWTRIADYGHTLSGMRAEGSPDSNAAPLTDAPELQYTTCFSPGGEVTVTTTCGPALNFAGKPVRYAVAFDAQPPQIVTLVPANLTAHHSNRQWVTAVMDNAHRASSKHVLSGAGAHVLRIWMVDPGVVLQKIVIDCGGLKRSYLGPPESIRR
jgi:hypothetical protein